ncbi:MAG: VpsR-related response regulator [bacterium]|jgi:PleD family two-component response regulator|nr:VpsR-related response regulator [bacterium]
MIKNKDKVIAVFGSGLLSDDQLMKGLKKEFKVVTCPKIEELISNLNKLNVSVVLVEIDDDDIKLKSLMRLRSRHGKTPIIALGEGRQQEIIAKAFQLGVCDFFKVPSKFNLLVEKVRSLSK